MGAPPGRMGHASQETGQGLRQISEAADLLHVCPTRFDGACDQRWSGPVPAVPRPASRARTMAWLRSATRILLKTLAT